MAVSTNCCLKFKPPTASPASRKPLNSWLPGGESQTDSKWPARVASIVIGIEMANLVLGISQGSSAVVAIEIKSSVAMKPSKVEVLKKRWSEKRICPPWHTNSLENIVPENLPRPSAKRRFEAVGYDVDAPPVKFVTKHVTSTCFTM